MTVRLKDIAAASGVSVGAVQQILAGRGERFRDETCRRVRGYAQSLGYRPDVNAMALRTGRSYLIGVLMSGVNYTESNGFFEGIQIGLGGTEYAPICFTHGGHAEEADFIKRCLDRRVDGLIVNAAVDVDANQHTRTIALSRQTPLVEVFGNFLEGVPSITNNDEHAGATAVERLVASGCNRICLFTHDQYDRYQQDAAPFSNAWRFYEGCASAAKACGVPLSVRTHPLAITPGDTYEMARQSLKAWAVPEPERMGFCCFGIEQGQSLAGHLQLQEYKPATETAAVVYGDPRVFCNRPEWVAMVEPDVREIGRAASEGLLRMIEGETIEDRRITHRQMADQHARDLI